jgi:hypothetical protein
MRELCRKQPCRNCEQTGEILIFKRFVNIHYTDVTLGIIDCMRFIFHTTLLELATHSSSSDWFVIILKDLSSFVSMF